jgi:small subunit ribosomal protein S1
VRVISITDFGVFVELERGVEGLVPMSELSYDRIDDARKVVQEGQIVKAEVLDVSPGDRRITLSLKKMEIASGGEVLKYGEERSIEMATHKPSAASTASRSGAKLGDLLKEKLGDKLNKES